MTVTIPRPDAAVAGHHGAAHTGETPPSSRSGALPEEDSATVPFVRPRLAPGTELLGEYLGSGFAEPRYLVRREDGQVAQLPRLLYALATRIDGHRDSAALASRVGADLDRALTPEQATFLVEERLRPVGILAPVTGALPAVREPASDTTAAVSRPDPLFLLRYRLPVLSENLVWRVAAPFRFVFRTPVLLTLLAAFVALEGWLVADGALGRLVPSALTLIDQPLLNLLVFVLIFVSGLFHECGHVTACRYGGARPGTMGLGLYLVWPAMYSTVTDAYRLDRGGRLRVDLGGVYFNVLGIAAMDIAYAATGAPWFLVAIVSMHVETVWQFLPSIRLDGYYILADLVGIPDLFSRFGPILRSLRPGRSDPRVAELKPWVRRAVGIWVALVIPCLLFWLGVFLLLAPRLIPAAWARVLELLTDVGTGPAGASALAVGQLFLLLLPWAGGALIVQNVGRRVVAAAGRRCPALAGTSGRRVARRLVVVVGSTAVAVPVLGQADYFGVLPPWAAAALTTAGAVLLVGAVADRALQARSRTRSWPSPAGWAAGLAVVVIVVGVADRTPPAVEEPHTALAHWLEEQTAAGTPILMPSGLDASLRDDGVAVERLHPDSAPVPGALAVLRRAPSPAEQPVARFGDLLVVRPRSATAPQELAARQQAGAVLVGSSRLLAPPRVLEALQRGDVDSRVVVLLAALTARSQVGVADLPAVEGEEGLGLPLHQVVVSDLDGRPTTGDPRVTLLLSRKLDALPPPLGPTTTTPGVDGVVLGWAVPGPPLPPGNGGDR